MSNVTEKSDPHIDIKSNPGEVGLETNKISDKAKLIVSLLKLLNSTSFNEVSLLILLIPQKY